MQIDCDINFLKPVTFLFTGKMFNKIVEETLICVLLKTNRSTVGGLMFNFIFSY